MIKVDIFSGKDTISFSYLKICSLKRTKHDWTILLLLGMAVGLQMVGHAQKPMEMTEEEQEQTELKMQHTCLFVLFGSFMLVIMFYFYKYIKIVLTISVALWSTISLWHLFE